MNLKMTACFPPGYPISRSESLRISHQILEQAERERLAIAEIEATQGIQMVEKDKSGNEIEDATIQVHLSKAFKNVKNAIIIISEDVPNFNLKAYEAAVWFQAQGKYLADALLTSLPQETLDNLLLELRKRHDPDL